MKNLFLLTILLSLAGVLSVDKTNEAQSFFYEYASGIIGITAIIMAFVTKYYGKKNYAYTYLLFFINIWYLKRLINKNKNYIDDLNDKISNTHQKIHEKDSISSNIKTTAYENIELWRKQIKLHKGIAGKYNVKILALEKSRNDLDIIRHLVAQMKSEPSAKEKVEKLESLSKNINKGVSSRVSKEIKKLIEELKTETRKDNIIQLTDRIAKAG